MIARRLSAQITVWTVFISLAVSTAACSVLPAEPPQLRSTGDNTAVRPKLTLTVATARSLDGDALDVYATDLPESVLAPGADLGDASGHLLHIHLFLVPTGGKTPIDPDASNASIRWTILARGEVGVYGGGGLVVPHVDSLTGRRTYEIRNATLEPLSRTPGFVDRLGASNLSGTIGAKADPALAGKVGARAEELLAIARESE